MITNLPVDFETEVNSLSRKPVQLIHFITDVGTYYLSDMPVGTADGLDQDYSPWIESWGTLRDAANITTIFKGGSLEIRAGTISIISSPESYDFIQLLFSLSIENIRVELYQWFDGLAASDMVLVDIMVCQDPIELSEASMLLNIDLVSYLMVNNPYLWTRGPGEERRNAVVGKAIGVPLIDLQTARWTKLVNDIPFDYIGQVFIDNGVGFPGSGYLYIDSEIISYSWITAAGINITGRGQQGTIARPHFNGARVTIPGAHYDYVVCTGPVQAVDNLLGNGEPYVNPVTLLIDQDPVIARFVSRPPWLKVEINDGIPIQLPDETLSNQFGNNFVADSSDAPLPVNGANINRSSGYGNCTMDFRNATVNLSVAQPLNLWGNKTNITTSTTEYGLMYAPNLNDGDVWTLNNGTNRTLNGVYGGFWYDPPAVTDALISLKMRVSYAFCGSLGNSDCTLWVRAIPVSGTQQYLEQETILNYDSPFIEAASFSGNSVLYDITQIFEDAGIPAAQLQTVQFFLFNDRLNPATSFLSTKNEFSISQITWEITNDTIPTDNPIQNLRSVYGRDSSALGDFVSVAASVKFSADSTGLGEPPIEGPPSTKVTTTYGTGGVVGGGLEQWVGFDTIVPLNEYGPYNIPSVSTWAGLQTTEVGLQYEMYSPAIGDQANAAIEWVKFHITYTPAPLTTPDEERIIYADTVTADVTSLLGADPTPAQVVQNMIETYSPAAELLDTVDFEARHQEYLSEGYFINGVIDGDFQLHDALRKVLFEGMARLLFNQGKIKLLTYYTDTDETVDKVLSLDNIALRSRKIKNQPVSLIKNDVTIIYDQNLSNDGEYDGRENYTDSTSISKFTRQEDKLVYDLVHSASVAQTIGYHNLDGFKQPVSLTMARVFMPDGYVLEKGDRVSLQSFVNPAETTTGNIVAITRTFGQGKNKIMNIYDISILNFIPESAVADGYGGSGYGAAPYGD